MSNEKVSTFQERFAQLVNESDKTTVELAKGLGISNQTISAWKNGTRSPKEPTILTIARYFGVNVDWLMGFDVKKEANYYNMEPTNEQTAPGQDDLPKTEEARILSRGIDKLPEEQRKQAVAMFELMFSKYIKLKGEGENDT